MTRQNRVARYLEVLDKYGEGNSFWNWEILDELTDEELFDENTITVKINIIREHEARMENPSGRYSEDVMEYIRQRLGLKKYDNSRNKEINQLSLGEALEHVCNWNGLIGYASTIKSWIKDIYKVDLNSIE